jgi:predicted lipoprotein with Yx(FWY)xxD motif
VVRVLKPPKQMGDVMMRFTLRRSGGKPWAARAALTGLLVSGTTAALVGATAVAQAQVAPGGSATSATVVQAAMRTGFGKMLVTVKVGHALYEHPGGSCSASCQSIWPPLVMPAGATVPKGASCLKTAKLGSGLQVTYHGQRLYTFTGDSGHSVNGNGLNGFIAAKVTKACP